MQLVLDDQVGRRRAASAAAGPMPGSPGAVEAVLRRSGRRGRRSAPDLRRSRAWRRTCRPWRSGSRAGGGRSARRRRGSAAAWLPREVARRRLTQTTRRSVGLVGVGHAAGTNCGVELRRRTRGSSRAGSATACGSSFWKAIVFARAVVGSLSPFLPIRFGVAARPTQRPISNGQAPSVSARLLPLQLQGADQRRRRGRAGRASAAGACSASARSRPAEASPGSRRRRQHEGEGGQAEVGLGLAAAGREEEQVDDLAVGVRGVGDPAQVHQQEGELERPPLRRVHRFGAVPCSCARRWRAAVAMARLAMRKASNATGSASAPVV